MTTAASAEVTASPASLTFPPSNWNAAQMITVTGIDDNIDDGDKAVDITLTINDARSDDAFEDVADQVVTVVNVNDDTAGFRISETDGATIVSEGGSTDTFSVVLTTQPRTIVVLPITDGNNAEATIDTNRIVFTASNWDQPRMVTVTGVDDVIPVADGDQTTTITVSVDDTGSDDAFDVLSDRSISVTTTDNDIAGFATVADQSISATTTDDDTAGFTVTPTDGATIVNESGTSDTLTVVLNAQPVGDVVIDASVSDSSESVADASITFTQANWDTAQSLTVTGVGDTQVDGDLTTVITLRVNARSDSTFTDVADQSFDVVTIDNAPALAGALDGDGNGAAQALSDGILYLRFMAAFGGSTLVNGVVDSANGTRTDPDTIVEFLKSLGDALDIDGNGEIQPLSDGILIIRFLAGFRDDALITGAVDTVNGTRITSVAITDYLTSLLPPPTQTGAIPRSAVAPTATSLNSATQTQQVNAQATDDTSRGLPDPDSMRSLDLVFQQLVDPDRRLWRPVVR